MRIVRLVSEDIPSEKRRLRRLVVDRILAMDLNDRAREEAELEQRFPLLSGLKQAETILLYLSHRPEEFDTRAMVAWAIRAGKIVACPRVDSNDKMLRLHRLESLERDLLPGPFGIPEPTPDCRELAPAEIDWALIPGVAFDQFGNRLGRGGGYYDRLLPNLRPEVTCVAMVLTPQWVETVPTEPHDRLLHGIVGVDREWFQSAPSGN